jgi:class 3 adenylate cyclase
MHPETRYARSGDVHVAYGTLGDGPIDLVMVAGWISNVEAMWEEPLLSHFMERLASFSRLIVFDKRGTGLSDRVATAQLPTLEQRMDDVRAVLDAVGSENAALFGWSEGGPMSLLFTATYPARTRALVVYGTYPKRIWSPDFPWAPRPEERQRFYDEIERGWGGEVDLATLAPTLARDEAMRSWWASYMRRSASPRDALVLAHMNTESDVTGILGSVHTPTLVIHRTGDRDSRIEGARWMAERIPGARFVELPGDDHLPWVGDAESLLDTIEEFLTGIRPIHQPDRVLTTVLLTDIVESTQRAEELGDDRWRDLLDRHHTLVRRELTRFRGREIDTAGDGFLATFDGPARAVRCAHAVRDGLAAIGITIRAGLHTGEVELAGDKVAGIAVHIAARIGAAAGSGEILVSSTVRDLVAGSGIEFEGLGEQALKGVAEPWRLYRVVGI